MDYSAISTSRPFPTDDVYMALIALEGNPQFKIFSDFLARRAISTAILSTEQTGENCHWLQGRSQELKDISNIIKNARKNFDEIRRVSKK